MERENTEKQVQVVKQKILGMKVAYHHDQREATQWGHLQS